MQCIFLPTSNTISFTISRPPKAQKSTIKNEGMKTHARENEEKMKETFTHINFPLFIRQKNISSPITK